MAGLGPYWNHSYVFDGSLFDEKSVPALQSLYQRIVGRTVDLSKLKYKNENGTQYSVLRLAEGSETHLTSFTLQSIMDRTGIDYEFYNLENLWFEKGEPFEDTFDVVGLSTTFICDFGTLERAIGWIEERYPNAILVVGGQFSNLKYTEILNHFPFVDYIIRGDGEVALPQLLSAFLGKEELSNVNNLVARSSGKLLINQCRYIDLEAYPSPEIKGHYPIIPYESMRGCPFSCKFCSYPAASPQWRYKSATKIYQDWKRYAEENGAKIIRSKDSTFTVPHDRFRELMTTLPEIGVSWEAYTRANVINSPEIVDQLEAANCRYLSIGFESMSNNSLKYMNKQVRAIHNAQAAEFLKGRKHLYYHVSFMVGYPGETPEDFEESHRFIVNKFAGRFMVHSFSLSDETMPVWKDAETFELEVQSPHTWKHRGMDSDTAKMLRVRTINEARWQSEEGVFLGWQPKYQLPLVPDLDVTTNYRIEKLIERLAFLGRDIQDESTIKDYYQSIIHELENFGIHFADEVAEHEL